MLAGKTAVKRNKFIQLTGATKGVNRTLEAKARALAGLNGYVSNLPDVTAEFVIDAYHRLFHIEKSFRMSEHDLRARPIYHHKRESIDAPSTSRPASTPSPPSTRYPTTSAMPSPASTTAVRTNLSQVR